MNHKEYQNLLIKHKELIVTILSKNLDSKVNDVEFLFNYDKIDCLIICNTAQIIITEIKPFVSTTELRTGISQIIDYKNNLIKAPSSDIFKKIMNYSIPTAKFINNNDISKDKIEMQFKKTHDYNTIFFTLDINSDILNKYKTTLQSLKLCNTSLVSFYTNVSPVLCVINNFSIMDLESVSKLMFNYINRDVVNEINNLSNAIKSNYLSNLNTYNNIEQSNKSINTALITILNNLSNISNLKNTECFTKIENVTKISDLSTENLRKNLIELYKQNSPISINTFKKILISNKDYPSMYKIQIIFGTVSLTKIFSDGNFNHVLYYKEITKKHKKIELIKKLQIVSNKNNGKITVNILKKNNLYRNIIENFGTIKKACTEANISYNKIKLYKTKDDIVNIITMVIIPEFANKNIKYTLKNFTEYGITEHYINKYYGTIKNFKKEFGFI